MWTGVWSGLTLHVRHLTEQDLPAIESVQRAVIAELAEATHYQALTTDEFQTLLEDRTIIGAFRDEELIAFRALLIPPIDEEHLGRDIGYPEQSLERIIYQEVTNVHPSFRGYRLQQHLGRLLMEAFSQDVRFDLVCATVAPFNIPSLKDKFALGLRIGALKPKYGGKWRYIFMKELHTDWQGDGFVTSVEMADTARQVRLLLDGWFGTGIRQQDETWYVDYEKQA
ncbi:MULTISPECIES: GNAT family N-acetyltransferase [Exiguobacterium]|uniref:GNAT family N-acetyltransferase n=1 Tax=Exiguobacterium TaxID=33986 RepID=UPI001BE53315|nr:MULTISPECIES: hypothetical protein [Exiguobacterium]MCT4782059.1 hypothetical protein [Exiguobacterium himgiriensis]